MFDSWSDHDFNRLISVFDGVAFCLVTPEFLGDRLIDYTRVRTTGIGVIFFKYYTVILESRKTWNIINILTLINLPAFFYYTVKGPQHHGPIWIQILAYGVGFTAAIGAVALAALSIVGTLLGVTRLLASRKRLFRLGAFIFIIARIGVLIHG